MLTMEVVLHFMYVVAIKDAKSWYGDTPMELSMVGFWNLIVVWLKVGIFFMTRLWPTLITCLIAHATLEILPFVVAGGWRGPTREYDSLYGEQLYGCWLLERVASELQPVVNTVCREEFHSICLTRRVRYVYVPLGGSGNVIVATLISFTFVALWHDLKLRLLAWGWLITLFIIPEMVLSKVITAKKVCDRISFKHVSDASQYGDVWWYRHARAIGGVGNVLMLMTANLVGFVIGLDGLQYLGNQLMGSWNGMHCLRVPVRRLTRGCSRVRFFAGGLHLLVYWCSNHDGVQRRRETSRDL
jgi:hypothetical protein